MHLFRAKGARRWRDFERRKYHVRSALRNPARRTVCLCLLTVQCKILGSLSAIRGIEISAAARHGRHRSLVGAEPDRSLAENQIRENRDRAGGLACLTFNDDRQ